MCFGSHPGLRCRKLRIMAPFMSREGHGKRKSPALGCRLAFIYFIYHVKTAGSPPRRGGDSFVHETHLISTCTLLAKRCCPQTDRNIHAVNLATYRRPDVGFSEGSQFYGGWGRNGFVYSGCGSHNVWLSLSAA